MKSLINQSSTIHKNEHVEIKKFYEHGKNFLVFSFKGKFTEEASKQACEIWKKTLNTSPSFIHIWDCEQMTGFDQNAKKQWMLCMNESHNQTEEIWLIADNILIRGAARLMSKFSKHQLKPFKNMDEIESWYQMGKQGALA